jgi:hypothetical protein
MLLYKKIYYLTNIDVKKYIDKNIGWCLTFVGVYIFNSKYMPIMKTNRFPKTNKIISLFSKLLVTYLTVVRILRLCQLINNPERRDYDVTKMGFKTGAGKT